MCVASFPKFPPLSPTVYPPFASPLFIYVCVEMSRRLCDLLTLRRTFSTIIEDENDREPNWWISWPLIWQLVLTWWWWIDNDEKQVWRIFSFFNFSTRGGTNEWTNDRYDVTCINAHAMNPACRQKINFVFTHKTPLSSCCYSCCTYSSTIESARGRTAGRQVYRESNGERLENQFIMAKYLIMLGRRPAAYRSRLEYWFP